MDEIDELYENVMSSEGHEIPMHSEEAPQESQETAQETAPQQTQSQEQQVQQAIAELEFDYKGKQIKAPFNDPRVKQWASMGYDYGQRMQELSQKQAEWESQRKTYEERFKPIDEWARQNPDQWKSLHAKWVQETQGQQSANPLPPEIKQTLDELKSFKDEFTKEREQKQLEAQQIQIKQEDESLDAEIKSVMEQYPDLDWKTVNEKGHSMLELQVLEYAQKRKISNFTDAFIAFNHKTLLERAEAKGKEVVSKNIQKNTKQGILGKNQAPTKALSRTSDVKGKSWDDLLNEGLTELGIAT